MKSGETGSVKIREGRRDEFIKIREDRDDGFVQKSKRKTCRCLEWTDGKQIMEMHYRFRPTKSVRPIRKARCYENEVSEDREVGGGKRVVRFMEKGDREDWHVVSGPAKSATCQVHGKLASEDRWPPWVRIQTKETSPNSDREAIVFRDHQHRAENSSDQDAKLAFVCEVQVGHANGFDERRLAVRRLDEPNMGERTLVFQAASVKK